MKKKILIIMLTLSLAFSLAAPAVYAAESVQGVSEKQEALSAEENEEEAYNTEQGTELPDAEADNPEQPAETERMETELPEESEEQETLLPSETELPEEIEKTETELPEETTETEWDGTEAEPLTIGFIILSVIFILPLKDIFDLSNIGIMISDVSVVA